MRLRRDERGQSIQVGVAILLGVLVIAMTIYQAQIVPSENAEVEFNHNQDVRNDLVELRNALVNAGTQGESDAVGVTLGTQYPPRAIFLNPAPSSGRLQTETIGNVSFGNVQVEGSADQRALLQENHATARISYVPDYAELDGAGTTVVEHSLAYNRFESGASSALTRQRLLRGDSLTLTTLQGDLAEQATGTFSLDPTVVSGPTDPITITNETDDPIELYLPTDSPDVWNETLGSVTDPGGPDDARVADWDPGTGHVRVELDPGEYQLQMAAVGVGSDVEETNRYDVEEPGGDGSGGGAYAVEWENPDREVNSDAEFPDCDAESCTWDVGASDDDTLTLDATTGLPAGFDVEFESMDSSVGTVSPSQDTTGTDGGVSTELTASGNGTVVIAATSDGGGDVIEIEIENVTSGAVPFESSIADQGQTGSQAQYEVSYDVTGMEDFDRVEVALENLDSGGADETYTSTALRDNIDDYGWVDTYGGTGGDEYEITIEVYNSSNDVAVSRTVTDDADGGDPSGNNDLSTPSSPSLESSTLLDTSQNSNAGYSLQYEIDDPAGEFAETEVLFTNLDNAQETGQGSDTEMSGSVSYSAGGAENDDYEVVVQVQDDDGIVVDSTVISDTADGSVSGADSNAVSTQVSNFYPPDWDDQFTVQAQTQDSDGDDDLEGSSYTVTDDSESVVASQTVTGSGQQIQPGTVTIDSDSTIYPWVSYTVTVTGYDSDGNYDLDSQNS